MKWAVWLVALLLLYVLSIGPLEYLQHKRMLSKGVPAPLPDWLNVFYQPAWWLQDHSMFHRPMDVYCNWWKRLAASR